MTHNIDLCPYCKKDKLKVYGKNNKVQKTCGELQCRIEYTKEENRLNISFYRSMRKKNEIKRNIEKSKAP